MSQIKTDWNTDINEDSCIVKGYFCKIYGNKCTIEGNFCEIFGTESVIKGNNNIIYKNTPVSDLGQNTKIIFEDGNVIIQKTEINNETEKMEIF